MQYAPTRTSGNGRCRSFAPEMFSDTCARRPFASVGNHFMGHRVPSAGRVGAYCIRPFKWPRRGQIRRRRLTFICLKNGFQWRRISDRRYCSLPGTWGAYAIRPYTDVRRRRLTFVRPRNVLRLRRMPVGCYCFLPGTWGAYAFAPLHGRPTMAADVHSPPKCFPIAADAYRALLFSAMNMGGVCNTPLHGRPTMAAVVHPPPKCFPTAADTR